MENRGNYNQFNAEFERFKYCEAERQYNDRKQNSKFYDKYRDEQASKNKKTDKDFWKLGGTVALIMVFFIILIMAVSIIFK